MNESFNVAPGGAVESYQPRNQINQIYGVWVDNFSGGWLSIVGRNLWVPPYTRGWKASIFPGMSQITVRSYNFANGAVIAVATGQAAIVTIWDEPNGDSEGINFFDEQTVPLRRTILDNCDNIAATLLPVPAIGRYRIYEVSLMAGFSQANDYNGSSSIMLRAFPFGFGADEIINLQISPASPRDSQFLTPPGGDCPIGASVLYDLLQAEKPGAEAVRITVRYAVM